MRRTAAFLFALLVVSPASAATGWRVLAWNDLGMHCTDGTDYSVFGILPPFNTIHAQVIDANGQLVRDGSRVTLTYEAVSDPSGSINRSSIGKTNFWTYANALFGAQLPADTGLASFTMPGAANVPQPMRFDAANNWFTAEGVPITPYDDSGAKNYYPMMRIVVRDAGGNELASTKVVLPVSDEMDCRGCHGPRTAAIGSRETKIAVLTTHDTLRANDPKFAAALAAAGYKPEGLLATSESGTPILCARCHASNALPGTGVAGVSPLTTAMHHRHASVADPDTGIMLDADSNRSSCYQCHPGATTRCLRGAMGASVRPDGELAIQCQNCHGSMSMVGAAGRTGWLAEPACQSCHTGTATANAGALRFTSAFVTNGVPRAAVNRTFATNNDVPAAGFSLYRFSQGHGGLACEACHGSTHAEYPSTHPNDNVQPVAFQGHAGTIGECAACHGGSAPFAAVGPHGMHTVGATWVSQHGDIIEHSSTTACQDCHGVDYRGTELTRALGERTLNVFGGRRFWRGYRIGCYTCHNGPGSESETKMRAPVASGTTVATTIGVPATIALNASDPQNATLTLHVVSQPQHGTAGIAGSLATYVPEPKFVGVDNFTFAAWNGALESDLQTVTINVMPPPQRRRAVH